MDFDDMWSGVGSAIGSIGGGLVSSAGQYFANEETMDMVNHWNQVQVDMANTAHQREVQDLKAAGLNPILSAQGAGAAVPSFGSAQVGNVGEGLAGGISSAAKLMALEVPKTQSQIAVNSATAKNLEAQNSNLIEQNELLKSQKKNTDANTLRTLEEADHPGVVGKFLQDMSGLFGKTEEQKMWEKMQKPDTPTSAHSLKIDVEAPRHRWWHHIPGFRDDISND